MSDDTQRFFDAPELAPSSDAVSVSFAQLDSAEEFELMAAQLTQAAQHCRDAAAHMLKGRVPNACAHGFAAEGHMRKAQRALESLTIRHAEHAEAFDEDA